MKPKDFTKSGGVSGRVGATWCHASGYRVQHCGHQTALRPYYIINPQGCSIFAPTLQAFHKLDLAQDAVRDLASGKITAIFNPTNERWTVPLDWRPDIYC